MQVFLNGSFREHRDATISVDDRGFLFGDGVYEVIRARGGRLFEPDAHFERLAFGLAALEIHGPGLDDPHYLHDVAAELLRRNTLEQGDATIYIQITRGAAPRTHHFPPADTPPTVLVTAKAFTPPRALQERGGSAITRPDVRWARCDIKTVNLLPNVLAKQEAVRAGATEAIFVRDGAVTDGASTTVFAVINGELRTPPLTNYILPGITRRVVLELAAELGIAARETMVYARDLVHADEIFVTGTTSDVQPICELDGQRVGTGVPGPVTCRLRHALVERLATFASVRA